MRRYPDEFDLDSTVTWMREIVLKNPLKFYAIRTDNALCISVMTETPWQPNNREISVVVVLADFTKVWETLPLLRASVNWARKRKAVSWRFQSDTEHDIGPLMQRLGAAEDRPRYQLKLRSE